MRSLSPFGWSVLALVSCSPDPESLPYPGDVVFGAIVDSSSGVVLWSEGHRDGLLDWPRAAASARPLTLVALTEGELLALHPAVDLTQASEIRLFALDQAAECPSGHIDRAWRRIRSRLPESARRSGFELPPMEIQVPISASKCGEPPRATPFLPGLPNPSVVDGESRRHMNEPEGFDAQQYFLFRTSIPFGRDTRWVTTGLRVYEFIRGRPFADSGDHLAVAQILRLNVTAMTRSSSVSALAAFELIDGSEFVEADLRRLSRSEGGFEVSGPLPGSVVVGNGTRRAYRSIAIAPDGSTLAVGDSGAARVATSPAGPYLPIDVTGLNLQAAIVTGLDDWPLAFAGIDGAVYLAQPTGRVRPLPLPSTADVLSLSRAGAGRLVAGDRHGRAHFVSVDEATWRTGEFSLTPDILACAAVDECGHNRITSGILDMALHDSSGRLVFVLDECQSALVLEPNGCTREVKTGGELGSIELDGDDAVIGGAFGTLVDVDLRQ